MILPLTILIGSLSGAIVMVAFKIHEMRTRRRLFLSVILAITDRHFLNGFGKVLAAVLKAKSVMNTEAISNFVEVIFALIGKAYVIGRLSLERYIKEAEELLRAKKANGKRGAASFFIKDILDYKKLLQKKRD